MLAPSVSSVGTGNRDRGILAGDGDHLYEKEPTMPQVHTARRMLLALGGGVLLGALTAPGVALAASPSASQGASVLIARTVPASGGVVRASDPFGSYAVTVPPHAFTGPVQVAITEPPSGAPNVDSMVAGVGVQVLQNSHHVTTSLAKPLTLTISASGITGSSIVASVASTLLERRAPGTAKQGGGNTNSMAVSIFHPNRNVAYLVLDHAVSGSATLFAPKTIFTPKPIPPAQPIVSGAYGNVLAVRTISPYGGAMSGTGPAGTVYTLTVPTGAFQVPETLVLLSSSLPQPGNINAHVSVAVMRNGIPIVVPFLKPLSLAVNGPNVDESPFINAVAMTGLATPVRNAQISSNLDPSNYVTWFPVTSNGEYLDTYVVRSSNSPNDPDSSAGFGAGSGSSTQTTMSKLALLGLMLVLGAFAVSIPSIYQSGGAGSGHVTRKQ